MLTRQQSHIGFVLDREMEPRELLRDFVFFLPVKRVSRLQLPLPNLSLLVLAG